MNHVRRCAAGVGAMLTTLVGPPADAGFSIDYTIEGSTLFSPDQLQILSDALDRSRRMWETAVLGYQPGITITTVPISVFPVFTGLAAAAPSGSVIEGGFRLTTAGYININVNQINAFANWQGVGANDRNYLDELLAHETGHVLGIGTQWITNGAYTSGSYQYTGTHGLASYQAEFDPLAMFVPVENAGGSGTRGSHWDQRMRSSAEEGDPFDPWSLDPRMGIVDDRGRDLALELMTGALDPDYGEPFLSRTTVESLRDLGFVVASFYDFNRDGVADAADASILTANLGLIGLEVDSLAFGDVDRDRDVDEMDLALWTAAVPEPSTFGLVFAAAAGLVHSSGGPGRRMERRLL